MEIPSSDYCDFLWYSEKYNLEFYNIPKNGMTATIYYLELKAIPRIWITATQKPQVFCILRNPIDRTISSYSFLRDLYALNTGKPTMFRELDDQLINNMFFGDLATGYQLYLDELSTNGPFDEHNLHQYMFLTNQQCPHQLAFGLHKMTRSIEKINTFINFDTMVESIGQMIGDLSFTMDDMEFHPTSTETKATLMPIALSNQSQIITTYQQDYDLFTQHFL